MQNAFQLKVQNLMYKENLAGFRGYIVFSVHKEILSKGTKEQLNHNFGENLPCPIIEFFAKIKFSLMYI